LARTIFALCAMIAASIFTWRLPSLFTVHGSRFVEAVLKVCNDTSIHSRLTRVIYYSSARFGGWHRYDCSPL